MIGNVYEMYVLYLTDVDSQSVIVYLDDEEGQEAATDRMKGVQAQNVHSHGVVKAATNDGIIVHSSQEGQLRLQMCLSLA